MMLLAACSEGTEFCLGTGTPCRAPAVVVPTLAASDDPAQTPGSPEALDLDDADACDFAAAEGVAHPDASCAPSLDLPAEAEILLGDVTGDRADEVVYFVPDGRCWYVTEPDGTDAALWLDASAWPTRRWIADVTGDGAADAVWFESCADDAAWYAAPSTGSGFSSSSSTATGNGEYGEVFVDEVGGEDAEAMIRWCDFDGDGDAEPLVYRRSDPTAADAATWTVGVTDWSAAPVHDWLRWGGATGQGDTIDVVFTPMLGVPAADPDAVCDLSLYKVRDDISDPSNGSHGRWFTLQSSGEDFEVTDEEVNQALVDQLGEGEREHAFVGDVDGDGADDVILHRPASWAGDAWVWIVAYSRFDELTYEGAQRDYFRLPVLWPDPSGVVSLTAAEPGVVVVLDLDGDGRVDRGLLPLAEAADPGRATVHAAGPWRTLVSDPPDGCAIPYADPSDAAHYWYHCTDDPLSDHADDDDTSRVRSWGDASAYCQARGDRLVQVDDEAEQVTLRDDVVVDASSGNACESTGCTYWIGLSDATTEGTWVWESGAEASFTSWREDTDEPNGGSAENCVQAYFDRDVATDSVWNDLPCREEIGFVCEHGP